MKVKPATAKELGIKDITDPQESIAGGTRYLKTLYDRFSEIEDTLTRIKFTMAAYNCGYEHVRDAQRLAEERKLDTTTWEDHVEKMLLALSYPKNYNLPMIKYGYVRGSEPVNYIQEIFDRYQHYQKFF
jgi:membrane-bound lytic murein transglycosylase F